jgi:hypothetical protein
MRNVTISLPSSLRHRRCSQPLSQKPVSLLRQRLSVDMGVRRLGEKLKDNLVRPT